MKTSDQHVYVCFFDSNELMPFQQFGPFEWADLEGLAIRAKPPEDSGSYEEVVYVATYMMPGTDWTPKDAPGEGWVATKGDTRFTYTDVSICPLDAATPYKSPKLTDDQIRRLNDNDQDVRESVQEDFA